jgi:chromosome segregation ATPase
MVKTRAVINESSDSDVAVAKLQSSLSRLQSRLDDATDIIKSQQSELERLQQDSNSSTELDTEREERKESESQICYLQNLLYSKIQDNDTLAQELERTLDVSKEILREKAKRESEVQTLLVQVDQLTDVNKELLESMEGMLDGHHRKEAEYVQTIRDMTYENEELKRKLNESNAGKSSFEKGKRKTVYYFYTLTAN